MCASQPDGGYFLIRRPLSPGNLNGIAKQLRQLRDIERTQQLFRRNGIARWGKSAYACDMSDNRFRSLKPYEQLFNTGIMIALRKPAILLRNQ